MKALAINGSPRPGGNTEILLKKVLEPLEATIAEVEARANRARRNTNQVAVTTFARGIYCDP